MNEPAVCNMTWQRIKTHKILPVKHYILKLSTITFRALGSGRPPYLASLLNNYSPPRTMRSSSAKLLTVPHHNLSLGSRAFRISAPTTWNSLPQNVRDCSSLASFRNHLKTH